MRRCWLVFLLITGLAQADQIEWRGWEGAFELARQEQKLVVLDLEAVWCHWCHVMDKTTYRDPRVVRLMRQHVVPVKVDQDSRPDLAHRYEDYGWPATIIFDSQGRELARLSGYVKPGRMAAILESLAKDPVPLEDVPPPTPASGVLSSELVKELESRHFRLYDEELGGWGSIHKFVNTPVVEYCLARSLAGDSKNGRMARKTLDANLALIDSEWGGVYQYSDSGVWNSPHFEKIMETQAGNLRVYSLAYAQFEDPRYLQAAEAIAVYMNEFLKGPEGAYYVSQDADLQQGKKAHDYFKLSDAERRSLGIPRVDTNLYARENGWAIEAMALYGAIAGRPDRVRQALTAAHWVVENRTSEGGGFHHGSSRKGLFLGDTLACGQAFLTLYRVTAEPAWLERAQEAADFIEENFSKSGYDGFFTSSDSDFRHRQENISMARFANLLYHHTGEKRHRALAQKALNYFGIEGVTDRFNPGGVLLASFEFERAPLHITVVSSRSDQKGQALRRQALVNPSAYFRLDWWEPGTPLPPHSEVEYPDLGRAAAFVCSDGRCSAPVFEAAEVSDFLR